MRTISELRADLGWSQNQMAEVLGCSQPTIDRIEGGQPASGATARLAARLDHLLATNRIAPAMPVAGVIAVLVRDGPARDAPVSPALASFLQPRSA